MCPFFFCFGFVYSWKGRIFVVVWFFRGFWFVFVSWGFMGLCVVVFFFWVFFGFFLFFLGVALFWGVCRAVVGGFCFFLIFGFLCVFAVLSRVL